MRHLALASLVAATLSSVACGSNSSSVFGDGDGDPTSPGGGTSGGFGNGTPGGSDGGGGRDANDCSPNLTGLVRDFRGKDVDGGHPDFQAYQGTEPTTGLVARELGPDKKPVFASTTGHGSDGQQLTSKADFDQWYRDTAGVNETFPFVLPLKTGSDGIATFASSSFFPIDGKGFGNSGTDTEGALRNFHFTFELHLEFLYRGGEVFTFTGDDDLWTFFNGKLGIDLGGLHPAKSASVSLDDVAAELGIEKGKVYPLDVFHAERRTTASNFRIDTTLSFVNCDPILVPK